MKKFIFMAIILGIAIISCQNNKKGSDLNMDNPFFRNWTTTFGVPPFDEIKEEHYLPAVKEGIGQHEKEINNIIDNNAEPTFENTILALDKSGELLDKVTGVFFPLNSANTNDSMQAVAREILPLLTKHSDNISLNPALFKKIKEIYDKRNDSGLDDQQIRVTIKYYEDFVRNGANLNKEEQDILRNLNEELSKLSLQFEENLLAETNENFKLVIDKKEDLAGLPEDVILRAAEDAKSFGEDGKWVFTLAKPSMIPFLQFSEKRDLREELYKGYFMRCDNDNQYDNKEIIKKMVKLRDQRAKLLGFNNHAEYIIDVNMAKTPQAVYDFLLKLWYPAVDMAKKDVQEMQRIIDREGGSFSLESWDWWYYNEKLRKEKFDLDEAELKQYFSLENTVNGLFYVIKELYGLNMVKREDLQTYHPEAIAYEVQEADGSHLGVLYMDFHPRGGKR
ncbi:MAG: M3 family metallopeptidase, partial [Prolixibacteraceae bacterium]|nr:M3 family metallopeptidase [Prolixibacteraceae bacterium]